MTSARKSSLVLTVLNEELSLPGFLESLGRQTVMPSEVIVVDGGSSDQTVPLLHAWRSPTGEPLIVTELPGAGISEGRNQAVRIAVNEHVLVTDGGTILDPQWVEFMLEAFDADEAPAVVGGFFLPVGETFVERVIAFTITPLLSEIDSGTFLPSSRSFAFKRPAWEAAGGYPEWLDYCEDLVFDLEMKKLGLEFAFAPKALVTWSARPSISAFMKQYYRYARGDGKASLWAKRHAARYIAYLAGFGLLIASPTVPWLLVALFVGFVVYMRKFFGRVFTRRVEFGKRAVLALATVPVVVVAGDLAKMAGYPAGLLWRARNRGSQ